VVVTGVGAVSGFGAGAEALWRGLLAGERALGAFQRFDATGHRTRLASEVPAPLGTPRLEPPDPQRLSLADRFAVTAAREALRRAGLEGPLPEAGVLFGSSTGAMYEAERFWARLTGHEPGTPRMGWIVSQEYNGPGDAVARAIGARGPVETVSSACTSGALSVLAAHDALRDGEIDVALAGGSDSLCQLTYAGFNALRAVDPEPCRPFRPDRLGLNLGEGAAVLVLETLERARERSATPLAELLAGASTCDAYHMTAPSPEGSGAAAAIRRALAEAGLGGDAVSFVNAHGTGTPLNDAAEWQALAAVFGDRARRLPVTAPKSSVGHLLGAAGSLEAVDTVLCLHHRRVHPTAGSGAADPASPVRLVLDAPLDLAPGAVGLSLNLAFGGSNAALLFRGWEAA
jgi:3-oxoacyl-[acyl-carrier-protein] synthase II